MKENVSDFSTEDIKRMLESAKRLAIKPIPCQDCGEGFYFFYFGNNKNYPTSPNQLLELHCYHHITSDVAIKAVGTYHDLFWN
jgi:hypothetical protein